MNVVTSTVSPRPSARTIRYRSPRRTRVHASRRLDDSSRGPNERIVRCGRLVRRALDESPSDRRSAIGTVRAPVFGMPLILLSTTARRELTSRELEVLQLVARGLTNKEVACELGISARTVQQHTISIYNKLGCRSRVQVALYAMRAGILTDELRAVRSMVPTTTSDVGGRATG
jgi:DNA-binding CsgD family transcriptional regulator